jgi:hypothetical protein
VISVELARRLRDGGLKWTPAPGDRFVVADRDMDDDVFTLSEMTVEVHQFSGGSVIGFNGTTEWALDSIDERQSIWLPSETQLRERLAGTFRCLDQVAGRWEVTIEVSGKNVSVRHDDAIEAYGLALLHLVTGEDVAA